MMDNPALTVDPMLLTLVVWVIILWAVAKIVLRLLRARLDEARAGREALRKLRALQLAHRKHLRN